MEISNVVSGLLELKRWAQSWGHYPVERYLEKNPGDVLLHGAIDDSVAVTGSGDYRPFTWEDKVKKVVIDKPHIATYSFDRITRASGTSGLWSPIGLVLTGGIVTDECAYSIILSDGFRAGQHPSLYDYMIPLFTGEVLVMNPVAETLYIAPQSRDFGKTPRLSEDSARSLAQELNLNFAIAEIEMGKFVLSKKNN
jgi:hypothetical protein